MLKATECCITTVQSQIDETTTLRTLRRLEQQLGLFTPCIWLKPDWGKKYGLQLFQYNNVDDIKISLSNWMTTTNPRQTYETNYVFSDNGIPVERYTWKAWNDHGDVTVVVVQPRSKNINQNDKLFVE